MWIGSNSAVTDPLNFGLKDCSSRPPCSISTSNVGLTLQEVFRGRSQGMLLIENRNEKEHCVQQTGVCTSITYISRLSVL
jgi:hypothetical protein